MVRRLAPGAAWRRPLPARCRAGRARPQPRRSRIRQPNFSWVDGIHVKDVVLDLDGRVLALATAFLSQLPLSVERLQVNQPAIELRA